MNKKIIIMLIIAVLAGGAGGYWLANSSNNSAQISSTAAPAEKKPLFYRNPMNPEVTSPVPAQDQMGMGRPPTLIYNLVTLALIARLMRPLKHPN